MIILWYEFFYIVNKFILCVQHITNFFLSHDLWTQILHVSQSTQVMLRVFVGSSTSLHIEHGTSESSLLDSSSETSTQTLSSFSATENVNDKVDCFLLRCTFSTTVSTFSM